MCDELDLKKKMIYEVLKESDTPLMAKRIAYQIYQKFNGYKLSRYKVRSILWKHMRNDFRYDKSDYTYKLKETTQDSVSDKENLSLEKFTSFIYALKSDELNPLLYPFVYKLPKQDLARKDLSKIKSAILESSVIDDKYNDQFERLCSLINGRQEDLQDWKMFYILLKEVRKSKGMLFSDKYISLKDKLNNPIHCLIVQLDEQKENQKIKFNNPKFQSVFDEISRDNRITEVEEKYLYEKALSFGVKKNKLKYAIETTDFKAFRTFKRLVDEICEDGVITKNEKNYIEEKASEYNISVDHLDRMIKTGLRLYRFINTFKNSNVFHKYINCLFLSNSLGLSTSTQFYEEHEEVGDYDHYIELEVERIQSVIKKKIELDYYVKFKNFEINAFLYEIDLRPNKIKPKVEFSSDHKSSINEEKVNGIEFDKRPKGKLQLGYTEVDYQQLLELLNSEKVRIGDPAADLLVENIIFRLKHE